MGDPVGLDLQPVMLEDPFLDLLVGYGLGQHNVLICRHKSPQC
jgi:hypothetical protein